MLEAGRNYVPETETPMFHTPDQAPLRGTSTPDKEFGFYDSTVDGGWQIPGEPYSSASERNRAALLVVARAHARRTHESLGPHFTAQRPVRFQAALARRARLRLADRLRRRRAVLRQSGNADRRVRRQRRHGEHAELLAGLPAAAAEAARGRAADPQAREEARRPGHRCASRRAHAAARSQASAATAASRQRARAEDPRRAHAQPRGLLLGDGLRPRLLDPRDISVDDSASAARDGDGQSRHPHASDGARSRARQARSRFRRRVHRQDERQGASREGARHRARRERVRDRAHHAQLEIRALPARARELERQGRQVSDGHGRLAGLGPDPDARKPAAAERGRRRRHPRVLAVVALQGTARRQARLRARLSHRDGQRAAHAERRQHGGRWPTSPAVTAASSRKTCGATTARSSACPAAAR